MWEFRGRRCTSKWTPWMKKSQPFHFTQSRRRSQKSALKLSSVCSLYKAMDSLGGGNAGFSVCIPSCPLTSVLLPSLSCLLLSPHSLSRSVLKLLTLGGEIRRKLPAVRVKYDVCKSWVQGLSSSRKTRPLTFGLTSELTCKRVS